MDTIGVFVCNYNKAEMVVKCVEAVLGQSHSATEIYVIDNASEDDSVLRLQENFGARVNIVVNAENLGGSGGFGLGIRMAIEKKYDYFMLLDNDAILDVNALDVLWNTLKSDESIGICGAKILNMQNPEIIQDFGGKIDYVNYQWGGIWGGSQDVFKGVLMDVDYVASCAILANTNAVQEFGGFPEENFIYWDDIEWCTKCRNKGYRVVVNGDAVALHDKSFDTSANLFLRYYANRNRLRYFAKYLPDEQIENFYLTVTNDLLKRIVCAEAKGMTGTAMTYTNAFEDFINGKTGKADEGRILPYVAGNEHLSNRIKSASRVIIFMNGAASDFFRQLNQLISYVRQVSPDMKIIVYPDEQRTAYDEPLARDESTLCFRLCSHVTEIKENILPAIYIDEYLNAVCSQEDYMRFAGYKKELWKFNERYRDSFVKTVMLLRDVSR